MLLKALTATWDRGVAECGMGGGGRAVERGCQGAQEGRGAAQARGRPWRSMLKWCPGPQAAGLVLLSSKTLPCSTQPYTAQPRPHKCLVLALDVCILRQVIHQKLIQQGRQ